MTHARVRLSAGAAAQLAGLQRRRRGMLKREIDKAAALAFDRRFVQARTAMDVAAGEVIDNGKVLLVYTVLPRQELLRRIWGSELDRRLRSRGMNRLLRERPSR